ncbi:MAG TPA: PQQ-dependent sugar dehydrogenase [Candidatus Limnocylindrales bacterium]
MTVLLGCSSPTVSITPTISGAPQTPPAASTPNSSPTPGETPRLQATGTGAFVSLFASGFSPLTFVTNAGDGSGDLYVVQQSGQVFRQSPGQSAPGSPWLDISGRISSGGERGLLGLVFHPRFATNGRFLVDYTDINGNSVVSEFHQATNGTVDPNSEKVILTQAQPFPNHNGGMLAFGPDGYLYIGFGDGGSGGDPQGNGQNLVNDWLGKILRIDVDTPNTSGFAYSVPPTNPFFGETGSVFNIHSPEIWDWGLRNPWRFSFDSKTGALFIGDVGQNQTEEVDVEPAGQGGRNYGWNIMEGDHCYNATNCDKTKMTLPVVTYSHDGGNCSVTGGYVYRGSRYPSLAGHYFFADYCSGNVWWFDADQAEAGSPVTAQLLGTVPSSVTSFGQDEAGELYLASSSGVVYSLVAP